MSVAGGSVPTMTRWNEIERETGDFMARVRTIFDQHKHKTIATLRKDGSPRISGIEVSFSHGEMWFGGMYRSVKCLDLIRDSRFALHSASVDPPTDDPGAWPGDAKVAGHAVQVTDPEEISAALGAGAPPGPLHLFRADLREVVLTRVGQPADHLVVEAWHPDRGLTTIQRR